MMKDPLMIEETRTPLLWLEEWQKVGLLPTRSFAPKPGGLETAAIMNSSWWNERSIEIDERLYHGGASLSLEIIARIPSEVKSLALVFHNPTITHLANLLAQLSIPNVPTCGIVVLRPEVASWGQVEPGNCDFLDFEYPKKVRPPS